MSPPQPNKKPLIVLTPHADAKVIGTQLSLKVKKRYTEMIVDHGTVAFENDNTTEPFYIHTGQIATLGSRIEKVEVNDPSPPKILNFSLVSIDTGEAIAGYDPIPPNGRVHLKDLPATGINIRINTTGRIKSIHCYDSNKKIGSERFPPYSIAGDDLHHNGSYHKLRVTLGSKTYKLIPYSTDGEELTEEIKYLPLTFE